MGKIKKIFSGVGVLGGSAGIGYIFKDKVVEYTNDFLKDSPIVLDKTLSDLGYTVKDIGVYLNSYLQKLNPINAAAGNVALLLLFWFVGVPVAVSGLAYLANKIQE